MYLRHLVYFSCLCTVLLSTSSSQADPTSSTPLPVAITAFSLLGRSAMRTHAAWGSEFHLDQELRFGKREPWSLIVGGSAGSLASHDGGYWLYGGNAALKRDLDVHGDHGLELGCSIDVELLRPGHEEYGQTPKYIGPYLAYTWEFSHRFFAAAESGVAFRFAHPGHETPHLWGTIGLGVNALIFLCLHAFGGGFFV